MICTIVDSLGKTSYGFTPCFCLNSDFNPLG